jgi:hypothetical protein
MNKETKSYESICLECGSLNTTHRNSIILNETSVCVDCGFQWNPRRVVMINEFLNLFFTQRHNLKNQTYRRNYLNFYNKTDEWLDNEEFDEVEKFQFKTNEVTKLEDDIRVTRDKEFADETRRSAVAEFIIYWSLLFIYADLIDNNYFPESGFTIVLAAFWSIFCLYISFTTLIILFRGNRTGEQIKENKIKDIQHQINEIKQKTRKEYSYLKDLSN